MMVKSRFLVSFTWSMVLLAALSVVQAAAAQSHDDGSEAARQFVLSQDNDPGPHLGKALPNDLSALGRDDDPVNLREQLQGPLLVIKTVSGCPPCDALIDYAKAHAAEYRNENGAGIVILLMGSETAHPASSETNGEVLWLHTPDFLLDGVLGDTDMPAVYFFDRDLTLVGARTGLYDNTDAAMAAALMFPESASGLH